MVKVALLKSVVRDLKQLAESCNQMEKTAERTKLDSAKVLRFLKFYVR